MNIKILIPFLIILTTFKTEAQVYPTNYFTYPMDTPLFLSAPFGSIRDNHFHSGMDIRTDEKEGLPIYAIADGYVSRVKIQSVGYGNALYIDHPNGYTSVYGHLSKYSAELASYIKSIQYQNQSFEIDHFPSKNKLKVLKGQIIGYSGNTGTSSGPHLHFEIRDSRTEQIINPQLFNLFGADTLPPSISKIGLYTASNYQFKLNKEYQINKSTCFQTDSGFIMKDTIEISEEIFGIGIVASDYLLSHSKEYSIYGADLLFDHKKYFSFQINRFPFDKTRCVNVHIDYANYKTNGVRFQKLYLDDGNKIPLYPYQRNKGILTVKDLNIHTIKVTANDFGNREFTCYAYVRRNYIPKLISSLVNQSIINPSKSFTYSNQNLKIVFPEQCLYDTTIFNYSIISRKKTDLCDPIKILDYTIPLQKSAFISMKVENIEQELTSKLCMYYQATELTNPFYCSSEFKDGFIVGKSSNLGIFGIVIDTLPPTIKPAFSLGNKSINDSSTIQFNIDDNFSGINTFKGTINGNWALFEYDAKNNMLTYYVDENILSGKNEIEITVTDKKNNLSSFKTTFVKP